MTRDQCVKTINQMVKGIEPFIRQECTRLISSHGINLKNYEDDFVAPKIILMVALEKCAREYAPFSNKKHIQTANNLARF